MNTIEDNFPAQITSKETKETSKKLFVSVKKAPKLIQPNESLIPAYNTTGPRRGMSLIINNMKLDEMQTHTEADVMNLTETFRQLKLQPKIKQDLKAHEMLLSLQGFAMQAAWEKTDICIVVIISQGTGSMDTLREIAGVDQRSIKVADVIATFSDKNCPMLKGKPKIFLFKCCRGDYYPVVDYPETSLERNGHRMISEFSGDILIAYCTHSASVPYRYSNIGSMYLEQICKVFMDDAYDTHVEDLLKIVAYRLKHTPLEICYESFSFKNCYLNPI